jgi:hypothetical protein
MVIALSILDAHVICSICPTFPPTVESYRRSTIETMVAVSPGTRIGTPDAANTAATIHCHLHTVIPHKNAPINGCSGYRKVIPATIPEIA